MKFIFLILKKFLRLQKESKFLSTITFISIFGVALGVIILEIALSVLNGFEREIENRLVGFNLHLIVEGYESQLVDFNQNELKRIESYIGNDLAGISPFAGQLALLKFKRFKEGVYLKGILPQNDYSTLRTSIIQGSYLIRDDEDYPTIIIGKKLARKIDADIGDTLTAFSLQSFVMPVDIDHLKLKKFVVTGIYESGMAEYDDANAFIHLKSAQELFGFEDKISGYEIKLKNPQNADYYSIKLTSGLGYPYYSKSIFQMYRNIFNWIELQKKPIPVVLALITIVAIFNIISTLLIFVMDKTNSIGILRTLGANHKQIKSIFLLNGFVIGLIGTVSGNLIALILLFIQKEFDVVKIPEGVYFLDKVPISIEAGNFFLVSVISLFIAITFSYLPAKFASKIDIVKSIKFS